jgi:PKD repeat protein/subtilisin-like proprotein convertase family protein
MKKLLLTFFGLFSLLLNAQTFTNPTGGAIPDNNTEVCFPLAVSGLPTAINTTTFGLITACINITHTYDSDLKIRLKSPDGTVILLANNNGGSMDNFTNTCFSANGAAGSVNSGSAPFSGTYYPFQSTNILNNGQDPNGIWFLCAVDEVPVDVGTILNFSITFGANPPADTVFSGGGSGGGPCSTTNGSACACPDGTSNCDLLPDMTASAQIIQAQHTETAGLITLSNATPNIGWGPMEIHGSNSCWCDTVTVACSTPMCPDGSYPKQKLLQTIYHKNGSLITSYDTLTNGVMSYHPSHGHIHVDNWAEFTLRTATSNPDATTWPIVAAGSKVSFCLINLGDCTSDYGYCRDGNYGSIMTMADIPNSGFGSISGCGPDQGIYVGNLDIYSQGLSGMSIDLTGVCNGDYYIVSITDPDNNFLETDETNNWAATPITLTQQISAPVATFTYTATGTSVQFNNPPSTTYSYQWYFGDGGSSTSQNPTHVYGTGGTYAVTLIVTSSTCAMGDTLTQVLNVTVGTEDLSAAALGFSVFPNPATDNTNVSYYLPEGGEVSFELFNIIGKKVYTINKGKQDAGRYEFSFSTRESGLSPGVYMMRLNTPFRNATIRLIQVEK